VDGQDDLPSSSDTRRSRRIERRRLRREGGAHEDGTQEDESPAEGESPSGKEAWRNPRSRWARKKHKRRLKELEEEPASAASYGKSLSWDAFDFGESPKMDGRFSADTSETSDDGESTLSDRELGTVNSDSDRYRSFVSDEAKVDGRTSRRSLRGHREMTDLSPELVARSLDVLTPYVQPRRLERIDEVLSRRTTHARFLFENPSNPSNVWACLRTLDSFGIQHADVVVDPSQYDGKAALMQKRGMRTAMGSAVWMTVRQFKSLDEAVATIRDEEGCALYASDLGEGASDVRDLAWDGGDYPDSDLDGATTNLAGTDDRPICIVMGNEDRGISDEMRAAADRTFYLPMVGFAESFNLSVATAITLAYMSAASGRGDESEEDRAAAAEGGADDAGVRGEARTERAQNGKKGPLRPGDMDPHFLEVLRLRGVINSLAQKRMGRALLKKEGIVLPQSMYE